MGMYTCYPLSRGKIHISSRDVLAPPKLETGFLTHEADMETLIWGYKLTRLLVQNMPMYVGDEPSYHPEDESVESVRKYMKERVATTWHTLGTCAMGEVVDEKLKVIGTEALMCADLSICPGNVGKFPILPPFFCPRLIC
jgi:alcohol oxidase